MNLRFFASLSLSFLLMVAAVSAAPVRDQHVEAELVVEGQSIQPGATFWAGLRLAMDPHWHTYWKNCGDACQPTDIEWALPEGFKAGDIHWPYPIRFELPPDIVSYGYKDEVLLLVPVTAPASLPAGGSVTLKARASWLMCEEMCIPGKADLSVTVPVAATAPSPDQKWADAFAASRAALPAEVPGWQFTASHDAKSITLTALPPKDSARDVPSAYFFPEEENVINYGKSQLWARAGAGWQLTLARAELDAPFPARLRGVLVAATGWDADGRIKAAKVDIAYGDTAAPATTSSLAVAAAAPPGLGLWSGLLAMFLGGLILNLMPCVFPVLSLKIVGFVEQSKQERGHASQHAMAFTAGVLISMWVLAAILLSLRGSGQTAGWAFQMTNPAFVLGLIFLFLVIGLNMFGVFEMGVGLTSVGGGLQSRRGLAGSFFSGLLTTVAGAPCAGPFLGTAIGFTLRQSAPLALLSFTAMGLGTALPYALLSSFPSLLRFLPKPGAWMETMKQFMGFPMVATAAWFASTFVKLMGGVDALIPLMFGCILAAVGAWVYGKWGAFHRTRASRIVALAVALLLLAGGAHTALKRPAIVFDTWSPAKVAALRATGKPVFVDFTAEWCAICQVNKKVAIENKAVVEKFKAKGVTVLIADWTDQNAEVTQGLKEFDRAAVPLYVLYGRDPAAAPVILPQALTPGLLLDALDKL